jgi:hypothetical protein
MTAPNPSLRRPPLPPLPKMPPTGRNQTKVRRALIIAGRPLSTSEIARRIYARPTYDQVSLIYRAAPKFCERAGYRASRGKPVLWRLRAYAENPSESTPKS